MLSASLLLLSLPVLADHGVPLANGTHALLPNGLTLEVGRGGLFVTLYGARAEVGFPDDRPGYRSPIKALTQVSASDDKKWVSVRFSDACGAEEELHLSLGALWARGEAALGMEAFRRKEYAGAAQLFARALASDPELGDAALNEAAALALSGKTQEALEALDPLIAKDPARVYLACMTNNDLAPLLNGPRLVGLRAAVPGAAQLRLDRILVGSPEFSPGKLTAYEPVRGIVAAVLRVVDSPPERSEGPYRWHASLRLLEAKSGRTLLDLPLVSTEETEGSGSLLHLKPVLPSKAGAVSRRLELANRALAELGLGLPEHIRGMLEAPRDAPAGASPFSFAGTTLRLSASPSGSAELKDLASPRAPSQTTGPERLDWAVWLPGPRLAVFQWGQYPGGGCPKNLFAGISVLHP